MKIGRLLATALAVVSIVGFLIGSATVGLAAPPGTACPQIAVPSYFQPGALWDRATTGSVPSAGILIANPNSGVGTSKSSAYVAAVTRAKAAGTRVLGYVYTSYGARSVATVEAEIARYQSWYGITDIFFDEVSASATRLPYYLTLANYVHATTGSIVMLNPGIVPDQGYLGIGDIVVTFEGNYNTYVNAVSPSWVNNYPANKFQSIVYGVSATNLPNAMNLARSRNVGWVYVTNDNLPNPYDSLPSYWSQEVGLVASCASTPTPSDTTPPNVTITSPINGAQVSSRLTINASATDNTSVRSMALYLDAALLTTSSTGSVRYTGRPNAFAPGKHTITAEAYDPTGNVGVTKITVTR